MKIKAEVIESLPPGTHITLNGIEYIRMADSDQDHIVGFLLDPRTGIWTHWSKHVLWDDEVEVSDEIQA